MFFHVPNQSGINLRSSVTSSGYQAIDDREVELALDWLKELPCHGCQYRVEVQERADGPRLRP